MNMCRSAWGQRTCRRIVSAIADSTTETGKSPSEQKPEMSPLHLVSAAGFFVSSHVGRRREKECGMKIDGS